MDDPAEMQPEEEKASFGEEGDDGASEVPHPPVVVTSTPSLLDRMISQRAGDLEEEDEDAWEEAQDMATPVGPAAAEDHSFCPICERSGIFGVNEAWLYLIFALLGFLMGYLTTVHGRY